ncbi:MAG: DUF547 domain-containing protein [Acidobacteriota bacterium]
MKRTQLAFSLLALPVLLGLLPTPARAQEGPVDYSAWNQLLGKYYDPARGMNYKALKANDTPALKQLRQKMATVDVASLPKNDQFAYWINLYNISVVATVVDGYPVASIRDLSTDPIVRLNVFKKDTIAIKGGKISLDTIENQKIRPVFKDPRIHFAINCAAKTCPPIRPEAYVGARIGGQLDDQVRKFMTGPFGAKFEKDGKSLTVTVTKIMDWFKDDFEKWGGGRTAFLHKFVPADKQKMLDAAKGDVDFEFAPYDWKLNDTSK